MNWEALKSPTSILAVLGAALTVAAAFGLPVTEAQTHAILVFGGSVSVIVGSIGVAKVVALAPQTLTALVTSAIGVAVAFGLQLTKAQQTDILDLTGVLAGILLIHGTAHTVVKGLTQRANVSVSTLLPSNPVAVQGIARTLQPQMGRIGEGLFVLYTYKPAPPAAEVVAPVSQSAICHAYGPATAALCTEAGAAIQAKDPTVVVMVLPLEALPEDAAIQAAAAQQDGGDGPPLQPGPAVR